jgi:hypothetical protein
MILTEHPKLTRSQLLLLEGAQHPGHSRNNNDNAGSPRPPIQIVTATAVA